MDSSDEIFFSYSVVWKEKELRWASRWDAYLKVSGAERSRDRESQQDITYISYITKF